MFVGIGRGLAWHPHQPKRTHSLSGLAFSRGVPARDLERLTPSLHRRSFPAGSAVMAADPPGDALYAILSGSAKVHLIRPDGTEVIWRSWVRERWGAR